MYKIGIFDSGVGGLTVLKEIQKIKENLEIIYYADTFNSPYGSKTMEEVKGFCTNIVKFFIDNQVDLIVIACNTATVASIEHLKTITDIPIIGVINPGATEALNVTKNKKVAVLATPLTVKLNAYEKEISKLKKNVEVYQKGCELLCPMIEKGWENHEDRNIILKNYIKDIPDDVDTLILGCTHYPLIEQDIKKFFNKNIINPANYTRLAVENTIKNISKKDNASKNSIDFFISGELKEFKNIAADVLNIDINTIYRLRF